jgi:hypothetical protein
MNIKLWLVGILLITLFPSCENFLESDSPSIFTDVYIAESEQELSRAVSGVYEGMHNFTKAKFYNDLNRNTDVEFTTTTTAVPRNDGSDYNCFESTSYSANTINTWSKIYVAINRANDVVEIIEKSTPFRNADKNQVSAIMQMYGEVKTLRGMVYLELVRNWGDVPFRMTSSRSDEDLYVPPTDRDSILTTIITDLISVEPTMQWAAELPEGTERVSREFCQGLIARIALTRGGWSLRPDLNNPRAVGTMKRNSDYRQYYEIAKTYSEKVINSGQHKLGLSFKKVFWDMCNYIINRNDDMIFEIANLTGYSGEVGSSLGIPVTAGDHPYGKGTGSTNLLGTYVLAFDKDDKRRDVSCALYKYDDVLNQVIDVNPLKMYSAKWSVLYMDKPIGKDGAGKSIGINFPYMRYADVLLMYAEAVNELSGPTSEAKEALKTVRRRAFDEELWPEKVDKYVDNLNSKDALFDALVNERKLEFSMEMIRQYDLARWNLYGKVMYNLYFDLIEMGKDANGLGSGKYTTLPKRLYYTSVPNTDPQVPGKSVLVIKGLDQYIDAPPLDNSGKAYSSTNFLISLYSASSNQPSTGVQFSMRGYINPSNQSKVNPDTDPVRYLLPIPYKVINAYNGKLQNYYGFE